MALDKDNFLPAGLRKVQKIRKGLKSIGTSNKAGFFFLFESIHETWKRLEGSLLYERFFVYIFIPLLVGFLSRSSTLYQVLSPGILYESNFDIFVRFITRNPLDFPS